MMMTIDMKYRIIAGAIAVVAFSAATWSLWPIFFSENLRERRRLKRIDRVRLTEEEWDRLEREQHQGWRADGDES